MSVSGHLRFDAVVGTRCSIGPPTTTQFVHRWFERLAFSSVATASPLLSLPTMADDLQRIEAALRAAVRTSDDYLTEMATHLIQAGGKRLRPVLSAAAAAAGGAVVSDEVIQGGVAVELVQVGSLYHDDVIDEAETRRGTISVNARWGNHRAILAGDFLLARASEIAASLGAEVAGLLGATIGRLVEGQIGELQSQYRPERSVEQYLASITGKTASLFSAASRIGGIVADLPRAAIDQLTTYGLAYGMVFQIVDDVLDLTATDAELGKPSGHDLVEGVYTLPVILTLQAGGTAADELADLIGQPIEGASLDKALAIVRSSPGLHEAIAVARWWADQASGAVATFGSVPAAVALGEAAHHLIDALPVR